MRPTILVIAAGIPGSIGREFVAGLHGKTEHIEVVTCVPLSESEGYSDSYTEAVYQKFCRSLKRRSGLEGRDVLHWANVVLIFLERNDDTSHTLNSKFETEALVLPVRGIDVESAILDTGNQRDKLVSKLVERSKRTIEGSHKLLSVIAEELTNRENRTCLLLPPRNFGGGMQQVYRCVNGAISNGIAAEEFKRRIRAIGNQLPKQRRGKRRCFVGSKGLVFESPTKAGPRHGEVPDWGSADHDVSCILRGKMRFGVSYNKNFHYDCDLPRGARKEIPKLSW